MQTLQPGRASLPSVDAVSAVSVRLSDDAECVVKCDGIGLASMLYSLSIMMTTTTLYLPNVPFFYRAMPCISADYAIRLSV